MHITIGVVLLHSFYFSLSPTPPRWPVLFVCNIFAPSASAQFAFECDVRLLMSVLKLRFCRRQFFFSSLLCVFSRLVWGPFWLPPLFFVLPLSRPTIGRRQTFKKCYMSVVKVVMGYKVHRKMLTISSPFVGNAKLIVAQS